MKTYACKSKPTRSSKAATLSPSWAKLKSTLNALPDSIDIRDWVYQPSLLPVPPVLVNCHRVPETLDQGQEGACTGFALAAVANFLLHNQGKGRRVSPRMLYEMARRYDEWPGLGLIAEPLGDEDMRAESAMHQEALRRLHESVLAIQLAESRARKAERKRVGWEDE